MDSRKRKQQGDDFYADFGIHAGIPGYLRRRGIYPSTGYRDGTPDVIIFHLARLDNGSMQKLLIILGLVILVLGLAWPWLGQLPFGRLPGDLVIERDNFRFYFPLTTMVVISVLVSLAFWLFGR